MTERKQLKNIEEETRGLIENCSFIEREARKQAGESSSQLRKEANEIADSIFNDNGVFPFFPKPYFPQY